MNLSVFKYKTANAAKLLSYGFKLTDGVYRYETSISEDFKMAVKIDWQGSVSTEVCDEVTGEPYTLYLVESAEGSFVGSVRTAVEKILEDIAKNCYDECVFKSPLSKAVTDYVFNTYGDSLEFLWKDTPDCAITRRKDNKKWYFLITAVKASKLGLASDDFIEIIDLRADPEELQKIVDGKKYFHGYHMNKKHWLTLLLDGTTEEAELFSRIDDSYKLAKK